MWGWDFPARCLHQGECCPGRRCRAAVAILQYSIVWPQESSHGWWWRLVGIVLVTEYWPATWGPPWGAGRGSSSSLARNISRESAEHVMTRDESCLRIKGLFIIRTGKANTNRMIKSLLLFQESTRDEGQRELERRGTTPSFWRELMFLERIKIKFLLNASFSFKHLRKL